MSARIVFQFSLLVFGLFLGGCPRAADSVANRNTPGYALQTVIEAARQKDEKSFKEGLSRDFVATVERFQEFSTRKPELRGAFAWPVFMRSLSQSAPLPKEELIEGNTATVKAVFPDGREVKTDMVLEQGAWRLAVPPGMVRDLDHFEKLEQKIVGAPTSDAKALSSGATDAATRLAALAPDASPQARAKANALDAFDAGNLQDAERLLTEARKNQPDDEDLVVALGRLHVRQGRSAQARDLLSQHVKQDPKSIRAKHYLGMAYMLENEPARAIQSWQEVISLNPQYAAEFQLQQRIEAARALDSAASGRHPKPVAPPPAADAE